jgi:hypothetical protein
VLAERVFGLVGFDFFTAVRRRIAYSAPNVSELSRYSLRSIDDTGTHRHQERLAVAVGTALGKARTGVDIAVLGGSIR